MTENMQQILNITVAIIIATIIISKLEISV